MGAQLVWYASYASNMNRERFMCYVQGGLASGGARSQIGCTDQSEPLADTPMALPYELYFAGNSEVWSGGGVAFVTHNSQGAFTKGRAYLITWRQFEEIAAQESFRGHVAIDLAAVRAKKHLTIGQTNCKYDEALYCGEFEHYPVVTFTSPLPQQVPAMPKPNYVKMIGLGLIETYGWETEEAAIYLAARPGVRDYYSVADMTQLLS